MKGPRELKRYVTKYRLQLKSAFFDDLKIFKLEGTCKKWRKTSRRPRDGYGIKPEE